MAPPRVMRKLALQPGPEAGRAQVRGFSIRLGRSCYDHAVVPAAPLCPASISPSSLPLCQQSTLDLQTHLPPTQGLLLNLDRTTAKEAPPLPGIKPFSGGKGLITHTPELNRGKQVHSELNSPSQSTRNLFIKHLLTINYSLAIKRCS